MNARPSEGEPPPNFEFEALRWAENYRRALIREFRPLLRGRVIEIGAGIGQMTELLATIPSIERLLAIEPDPALCRQLAANLPAQPLLQGTIASLDSAESWNAIVSVNVLEHIQDDERELVAYGNHLRAEKGHLCLFVPARQEIYAPIDKDFGHYRRYSKPELKGKLEAAGFDVVRLRYFNWVGYFAWWLSFCLLRKREFDPRHVAFFDRAIFPWVYSFETHCFAPPFGQSLIAVAQSR